MGLGLSQQKFGILPQSFSDSIFAIFAEETGFLGSLFLIFLYLMFFWRSFKIGKKEKNGFKKNLAFGISFWICFQAFVNIGSLIKILPLSGIPLPFLSYGGSHLIFEMAAVGILLNISKS
jgi:cell division protein FtsW